ncbi:MAG: hypothetical protein ACTH4Y_08005 [Microbacterium gubbeenense]|uniref:hypothetical protein n=1 Tax=Microbacterium gubbeenense TaxID=159896 RepID=UPI003F9AC41F
MDTETVGTVTCTTPDCFLEAVPVEVPESDSYMCGMCGADLFPVRHDAAEEPGEEPVPEPTPVPEQEPTGE